MATEMSASEAIGQTVNACACPQAIWIVLQLGSDVGRSRATTLALTNRGASGIASLRCATTHLCCKADHCSPPPLQTTSEHGRGPDEMTRLLAMERRGSFIERALCHSIECPSAVWPRRDSSFPLTPRCLTSSRAPLVHSGLEARSRVPENDVSADDKQLIECDLALGLCATDLSHSSSRRRLLAACNSFCQPADESHPQPHPACTLVSPLSNLHHSISAPADSSQTRVVMSSSRVASASLCLTLLSLCLLYTSTLTSASAAAVAIAPGLVISVATNASTGSTHLLAFDPLTGTSLSSPAIKPWWGGWDTNSSVTIDPSSAFGDWFLHEDGIVYYLLFLSNTAQPPSQRMTQYILFDPTQPGGSGGWVAPTPGSSCMITQSSTSVQPALENIHLQRELGTMIGFTDFSLQDEGVKTNSSFLGLVSLMWNEPTCFLWPILSFAGGLPTPLKVASAAALQQESVPLTFSYVDAVDRSGSAAIVMLDVSSPLNASLLAPPSVAEVRFSLEQLNVSAAQFNPALIAGQSPSPNQPTFGMVQVAPASAGSASAPRSRSAGKRGNKLPATYLQFDDEHPTIDGATTLDFFPPGPATTAQGTDVKGQSFTALLGLVANDGAPEGQGAAAFFAGLGDGWALRGEQVDPEWILSPGATLSFVPLSAAAPSKTRTSLVTRQTQPSAAAIAPVAATEVPVAPLVSSSLTDSTGGGGDPDYHRPDSGPGLSTGQIVLIVVLVVAFFGGLCACWVLFERRRAAAQGVDPGLALTATQRKVHQARLAKREELVDEDGVAMGMAYEPPSTRGRSSMSFSQDI